MLIEQAVFTSSNRGMVQGYQVVAKTAGVSREAEMSIHRWSPSKMCSADPEDWTINFCRVTEQQVAISRTVLGGPEYSSRGGRQVVTLIALLTNHQFASFQYNALRFASAALALGWLRLPKDPTREQLEQILMPDSPLPTEPLQSLAARKRQPKAVCDPETIESAARLLHGRQRVAIIGAENPLQLAETLLEAIPESKRLHVSFTTGLPSATTRPFQLQFLPRLTELQRRALTAEGIQILEPLLTI